MDESGRKVGRVVETEGGWSEEGKLTGEGVEVGVLNHVAAN